MKKMNLKKKNIALLMAVTLAAASLSACGSSKEEQKPATEVNFADIAGTAETQVVETVEPSKNRISKTGRRSGYYAG